MARTWKKIKIGARSFFAPSDSPAIAAMLEEIAEFNAKNPGLLMQKNPPRRVQTAFGFRTTTKGVSKVSAMGVALGPRGEDVLKALGNLPAIRARKVLGATGKVIRPLAAFGGNTFAVSRVGRGIGLGLNILSVGPMDILVSAVFAIVELRSDPERFGEQQVTLAGDEDPTKGRIIDVFGKEDVFVSQESLQLAQIGTEIADQLVFGFIPESRQERATELIAALFIEPILDFAKSLVFTGIDPEGTQATGFVSPT